MTPPKTGKDPNFPQHLYPISFLATMGKLCEVILKTVQKQSKERDLHLRKSDLVYLSLHSAEIQCKWLRHMTLYFKTMSTTAVFLNTEKAIDTIWHRVLLVTRKEL
jgi:hypothetical protein